MFIGRIRTAGIVSLLIVPCAAQAQALSAVPPPACIAPKVFERISAPAEDIAHLEQQADDYGRCMKAYIDARQAAVEGAEAQAKAEADAGNAAAHQVNDLYAAVKAYAAKHAKD